MRYIVKSSLLSNKMWNSKTFVDRFHVSSFSLSVYHPVTCSYCHKNGMTGFRYRCLRCRSYQLCQNCFWRGNASGSHSNKHQMKEHSSWVSYSFITPGGTLCVFVCVCVCMCVLLGLQLCEDHYQCKTLRIRHLKRRNLNSLLLQRAVWRIRLDFRVKVRVQVNLQ